MKQKKKFRLFALILIVCVLFVLTAANPVLADEGPGNTSPPGPPETRIVHKWVPPRCMEHIIPLHADANGWEEGPCKPIPTEEPTPVPSPTVVPTTVPTVIPTVVPVIPVIDPVLPETLCSDCPCDEELGRMIELWEEQNAILERIATALENQ